LILIIHAVENIMSANKPDDAGKHGQQPEALATFAEAARHRGKKPDDISLTATRATSPLPGDLDREEEAAAKILSENATGRDKGGKAAARNPPDRTRTVKPR
jgi:hypothetical protein